MKLSVAKALLPVVQRVVLYGPPKSGKTQLASQLAEYFRLTWFDLENGMSPLLKLPAEQQERIDLIKIPDTKDVPMAIETMLKVLTGARVEICGKHGKGNCAICKKDPSQAALMTVVELSKLGPRDIVVIDSGTQLATSAMNWVMRGKDTEAKPERDEWGSLKFIMEKVLTNLQQAKYNIIFITHEDEVEMVDGKDKLVPVSGSRNTSRNTAKYFDHVVYCNLANKKHVFGSATTYAASVLTGSRLDVTIETLGKPSLLPFFEHLLEFPLDEQQSASTGKESKEAGNSPAAEPVVDSSAASVSATGSANAAEATTAVSDEPEVGEPAKPPVLPAGSAAAAALARIRARKAGSTA